MEIQLLYLLDCPWCVKTKGLIRESLKELGVKANVEEILIDTDEKAKKYRFAGSPSIRINGKDMQEEVLKGLCLPCEELAGITKGATDFVKQECRYGCRLYIYKGRQYPYPPKKMIKEAVRKALA